jgi:membrane fusion protein (multidrug efflux system)
LPTPFSRTTRSLAHDSSTYAVIAWLIGGFLLTSWLAWFCFASLTVYEISSKARLEVNHSAHPIAALVADKIVATPISLGQEVKAGEVLIELDSSNEKLRLQEEESRLKALPPQIASIDKQIAGLGQAKSKDHQAALAAVQSARSRQQEADSAVAFAKDNERRITEMSDAIPQIEALRARAESQKLSSARDALGSEIHRLEMDAQTRIHQEQAEIENLKRESARLSGEIETTQATIARLKQDIEQHLIRAPANGQIGELAPLQIGTYVAVGDKLGTVVPQSELSIGAYFPPASVLGRIHPGQAARMRLDGFPWAQFGTIPAKVSRVGAEIRDNQVRVEFTPELAADSKIILQHGLPGTIEVSIEQISPALMVLRSAGQLLSDNKQAQQLASEPKPK